MIGGKAGADHKCARGTGGTISKSRSSRRLKQYRRAGRPVRGALETFIQHMSVLSGHKPDTVVAVGETTLAGAGARPDNAISVGKALTGFIEVKGSGKRS
jgi:hypothetical protein